MTPARPLKTGGKLPRPSMHRMASPLQNVPRQLPTTEESPMMMVLLLAAAALSGGVSAVCLFLSAAFMPR